MTIPLTISSQGLYEESDLKKLSPQQIESLIQNTASDKLSAYAESFVCGSASALLFFGVCGLCCHLVADIALPIFSAMATAITPLITVVFAMGASLTVGLATGYAAVIFTKVIPELFHRMTEKLDAVKTCDLRLTQLKKYQYAPITIASTAT